MQFSIFSNFQVARERRNHADRVGYATECLIRSDASPLSRRALNTLWRALFIRTHVRTHVRTWLSQVRARARAQACQHLAALSVNPSAARDWLRFAAFVSFVSSFSARYAHYNPWTRFYPIIPFNPIYSLTVDCSRYCTKLRALVIELLSKITILLAYISGHARDIRLCDSFFGCLPYFTSISVSIRNDIPATAFKFALSSQRKSGLIE